jgi:hypothetical protein
MSAEKVRDYSDQVKSRLLPRRIGAVALIAAAAALAAPSAAASPLKQHLKERILRHQPLAIELERDILWSTPDSKYKYEFKTDLPIEAKDHGEKRYFRLVRPVGTTSLRALKLRELPEHVATIDSPHSPYFHDGAEPTTTGVITLNKQYQPVTTIFYSNGTMETARVGKTVPYRHDVVVGPNRREAADQSSVIG